MSLNWWVQSALQNLSSIISQITYFLLFDYENEGWIDYFFGWILGGVNLGPTGPWVPTALWGIEGLHKPPVHSLNGDFCWTLGRAKKEILARFIATHLSCCIAWGEGTILATYWWIFQAQKILWKKKKQDLTIKLAKFYLERKFHFCHIHQKKSFEFNISLTSWNFFA